jgi:hypothetical protein
MIALRHQPADAPRQRVRRRVDEKLVAQSSFHDGNDG